MALIDCPECGAQVSEFAAKCNKCSFTLAKGNEIPKRNNVSVNSTSIKVNRKTILIIVIGFILAIGIYLTACYFIRYSKQKERIQQAQVEADQTKDMEKYKASLYENKHKENANTSESSQIETINQNDGINNENSINDVKETEAEIFYNVEEMPSFIGGKTEYNKFVAQNLKYPEEAISLSIEGVCSVKFIVETDGSITNIGILKGVEGNGVYGQVLDNEALRIVKLMPKWKPGKQNGKAVRVETSTPIKFVLK
jgi:TonB family protein